MNVFPRLLVIFVSTLLTQVAIAHDLDLTLVKLIQSGAFTKVEVSTPLSRLVKTGGLSDQPTPAELDIEVRRRLHRNLPSSANIRVDSQADLLIWTKLVRTPAKSLSFTQRFDQSTSATKTIVATFAGDKLISQNLLDGKAPAPNFAGMVCTGVKHILSGLDHILFVIGLALLGGTWKNSLKVLTAFSLAHTVTLSCSVLGVVRVNPNVVEPLIALSIVALALEGLALTKKSSEKVPLYRICVAFGFGLIHGFGFAGGLTNLGFQGALLTRNLASFSMGIELGQIMILVPGLLLMKALMQLSTERAFQFATASSVALGMIGSFWFVERLI